MRETERETERSRVRVRESESDSESESAWDGGFAAKPADEYDREGLEGTRLSLPACLLICGPEQRRNQYIQSGRHTWRDKACLLALFELTSSRHSVPKPCRVQGLGADFSRMGIQASR